MTEYLQHLGFWTPGPLEIIIILVIALLIFGKRLPEVGRGLAKFLTEFRKGIKEGEDIKSELTDEVKKVKDDLVNEAKGAAGLNDSDEND